MAPKKKAKTKAKKKVVKRRYKPTVHPHLAKMLNHYAILNRPRDDSLNNLLYAERRSAHHLQQAFREQDQRIQQHHHGMHTKMNDMVKEAQDQHNQLASKLKNTQEAMAQGLRDQQSAFEKDVNQAYEQTIHYMSQEVEQLKQRPHQRAQDQDDIGAETARMEQKAKIYQLDINRPVTPLEFPRKRSRKTILQLGGSPRNLMDQLV